MNDPHVERLFYHLECLDSSFTNPPPIATETDVFRLTLENDTLTFEFKQHFASVLDARTNVEPFLRAWELDDALSRGHPTIQFSYKDAEVIDRNPPPPGTAQVVGLSAAVLELAAVRATVTVSRPEYPVPPKDFEASPDVETMWHRYLGYLEHGEPLQTMAYFCLTVIQAHAGSPRKAPQKYKIAKAVLRKLGELSSTRGDRKTARKATASAPLTPKEEEWIKAAILAIIRRVGELNKGSSLGTITMGDLPQL